MAWSSLGTKHRVAVNDEVLEVRAVQRRPLAERLCRESLGSIRTVPWKNHVPLLAEISPIVLLPLPDVEPASRIPVQPEFAPRKVYIRHADLEKLEYTSNCRRCVQMRRGDKAAGVPHTAVVTRLSEPWVTLEIRVSQPPRSASQNSLRKGLLKEILARKQAALERTTRSKLKRGASGSGNHSHSSSSSSSACATTSDNEVRPNSDIDLEDRDAMIDYLFPGLTKEQTIEANETYELLLTLGADEGVAQTTVAGSAGDVWVEGRLRWA